MATSCPRRHLGCRAAGRRSRTRRLTPHYLLPWRSSKTPQLRMRRWDWGISLVYLPCCLPLLAHSSFQNWSHTFCNILLTRLILLILPFLFLSQSSSLLTSMQSSSEVPSAAELVSAIEKLVKTKMVSVFAGLSARSCGPENNHSLLWLH